jgi:tRNA threonylcarbamoyladenosine biosynthesis protein TsaB
MIRILNIESSTDVCSISISEDAVCAAVKISEDDRSHSKLIGIFIEELLSENNLKASDFNAVAISSGPGSYTGLRIGTSTAKAFCFGANIPLISVNTMQIMAKMLIEKKMELDDELLIIPMLDAKRAEVYTSVFDSNLNTISETKAVILKEDSLSEYKESNLVLCGNGSQKAKHIINNNKIVFAEKIFPSAEYMGFFSNSLYNKNIFEDVAYYEPFYLKDFVATTPKNKVLNFLNKEL